METNEAGKKAIMSSYDESILSDLHKDAYGYRPRESFWSDWSAASEAERQEIWNDLVGFAEAAVKEEELQREQAKADFEAQIAAIMELGAGDRATALRWFVDSLPEYDRETAQLYGADYLIYFLNVPSSYYPEFRQVFGG